MKQLATLLLFAATGIAQTIGAGAGTLRLEDLNGKPVTVNKFDAKATVLIFISTKCPVSNRYNERLSALYTDYSPHGVRFYYINANDDEPLSEVAEHRRKAGFPFDVYKDPGNRMADQYNARVTPEAYVIDREGKLRYHGRIDDSQYPARINEHTLRLAVDSVLQGKPVDRPEARALGCTIKRAPKS
jgi:thiol-disulfide isomerase/thioredoxin